MVPASWRYPGSLGRIAWLAGTSVPRGLARFARTSSSASAATTSGTTRAASSYLSFSGSSFCRGALVRGGKIVSVYAAKRGRGWERDSSRRHDDASAFTGDISSRAPEMNPSVRARHERPVADCSLRRGRSESRAMNFVILRLSSIFRSLWIRDRRL